jgi:serine/threonine protein kinase
MGEVYRARDTKLDRQVTIKAPPEEFSRDKERLARFEREAKLLAALNHTNVATLYGLEEFSGRFGQGTYSGVQTYDVAPDGRFVIVRPVEDKHGPTEIRVVLNWFE